MNKISTSLYDTLRMSRPDFAGRDLVQTKAASVEELLAEMNILKDQGAVVFVYGKQVRFDSEIQGGSNIKIFPIP